MGLAICERLFNQSLEASVEALNDRKTIMVSFWVSLSPNHCIMQKHCPPRQSGCIRSQQAYSKGPTEESLSREACELHP